MLLLENLESVRFNLDALGRFYPCNKSGTCTDALQILLSISQDYAKHYFANPSLRLPGSEIAVC